MVLSIFFTPLNILLFLSGGDCTVRRIYSAETMPELVMGSVISVPKGEAVPLRNLDKERVRGAIQLGLICQGGVSDYKNKTISYVQSQAIGLVVFGKNPTSLLFVVPFQGPQAKYSRCLIGADKLPTVAASN
jgi:hypothetical protein